VNEELGRAGWSRHGIKQAKTKTEQLATLLEIEEDRLKMSTEAAKSDRGTGRKIAQLDALLEVSADRSGAGRAGMDGVLQRLGFSQFAPDRPATFARRAGRAGRQSGEAEGGGQDCRDPGRDVPLDQRVEIDTRNSVIPVCHPH
jgi:hypothetical protein